MYGGLITENNPICIKTKRFHKIAFSILIDKFAIMLQRIKDIQSDLLGISASLLCILHCLALPFLISTGNVFLFTDATHWHGMDYLFIIFGLLAVYISAGKSSASSIKLGFWMFFSVFTLSVLFHDSWPGMI